MYSNLEKQQTERKPRKYYRCRSIYHLLSKCPKPPKDNEKRKNQVHLSERDTCAQKKECENGDNDNYQKIYAYMAWMSRNDESPSRYFGDSLQLTNLILYSEATCHMIPQV